MTTALDLIQEAYEDAGILGEGQTLSSAMASRGLTKLNDLVSQLNRKRWTVFHLVDTSFTANGNETLTVGPGGNFPLDPRPDRIERAYFVQIISSPNNLPPSYPLELLESYEDYSTIVLKTLVSWPQYAFYDSDYPTAKLYINPIPTADVYDIHILTKAILSQFATLTTAVNLPLEYLPALKWNLVLRLIAAYPRAQMDMLQFKNLKDLAKDSLNVLRQANAQIPELRLPRFLIKHGLYNVWSDRS